MLALDDDARRYLHELARPLPTAQPSPVTGVPPGVAHIVASWPGPVVVADHLGEVLTANPLAQALSPAQIPGVNAIRTVFLDPAMRSLYHDDWERVSESVVSGLRALTGADAEDPRLVELVGELSIRSPEFRALWARHTVRPRIGGGITRLQHPIVGAIALHYEKLLITGPDRLGMVIFHAPPGTPDAEALARLATMTTDRAGEQTAETPRHTRVRGGPRGAESFVA